MDQLNKFIEKHDTLSALVFSVALVSFIVGVYLTFN